MYGKVKTSIWAIDDQPLPLKRTQIRGRIWNFQAKLTIEQEYEAPSAGISKKTAFKFPLHDLGTICGYEAVVGGKRIASEIKKKKEASSKFKEATNTAVESHVKYDCSDVLVCHVSKLAPNTSIVIKVTCVTELLSDGDTLRLVLPTTIAPRIYPHEYKDNQPKPAVLSEYELGLDVNVQTFLPIEAVTSPTHPVVLKHLDNSYKLCNVTLDAANTQPLTDADLVLDVKFKLPISHSLPHCFVEKYEEIKKMVNRTALMIAFQPQFEELIKDESEPCEYLIVVDSAQQPDYELVQRAVAVALEELKTQRRARFNLFVLSNILYRVFEEESVAVNEEHMKAALEYVHGGQMEKDFKSGSRELYVSLEDVYSIPRINQESQVPIQMLLITTAQVSSSGTLLSLVSSHAESYTVFPLGIGVGANYYVLNSIARMSFGYAEFEVAPDLVLNKVRRQVRRGLQTMLDEVTLDWGDLEEFVTPAPEQLPLVFSGDFLAVYAFLEEEPDQKKFDVTLKAILGDRSKKFNVTLDLDTTDSINDNTIHLMTATERLFDLEEEMEDEEENEDVNAAKRHRSHEEMELIAINYGFASNYTSFFINDKATQTVIVSHYNDVSPFDEEGDESEPEVEEEPVKKKKVYDLEFMLRYQPLCTERPEGMTNITSIVKGTTPGKDNKRQPEKTHLIANKSKKRQDTRKKPGKDDKVSTPKKKIDIKGKWSSGNEVPVNHEALYKKITSLLNKLTRENFKSITEQILKEGAGITDLDALRGVIKLIFDKAVIEHNFSTMYADLCVILADQFPQFEDPNSTDPNIKFTFKRLLLNECQREFEDKPFLQETNVKVLSTEELEIIAKKRMLGNINFVGELYKKKLLASKIIHGCIIQLLGELRTENPETTDKIPPVENLELLCKLMRTVGKILETDKDSQLVDVYFHTVAQLSKNKGLDRRSYFMLLDLVDLRKAKWIPRSPQAVEGPKTISEIHRDAKLQEREQRLQLDRELAKSKEEERAKRKQDVAQGGWETVGSNTSTPAGKGRRGASTPGSGRGGRDTGRGGSAKKGRGGKDVSPGGRDLAKSTSGTPRYGAKDQPSTGKKTTNPRGANMFDFLSSEDSTPSPTPSPYKPRQGKNEPKRDIKITASMEIPRDDESDEEEVPAKFQPTRSLAASMSAIPPPDDDSDESDHGPASSDEPSGDNEAKIDLMLEEYLTGGDIEDALHCLREFKATTYHEFVNRAIVFSLEKKEKDCDAVMRLLTEFYKQSALNKSHFEKGFAMVLELVEDFYIDIPFTYKYVGQFFGHVIAEGVLTLNDLHSLLQPLLETEAAEKIAAEAFGKVLEDSGADRLSAMIDESKLSIKDFVQTDYKSDANYIKKLLESSKEALKTILLP